MLGPLRLFTGIVCLLIGAGLLYDALWGPDLSQPTILIGGAVLLVLGLISIYFFSKDRIELRKYFKQTHYH
jgi:high-affinity Fe2+/Pb2+ permease